MAKIKQPAASKEGERELLVRIEHYNASPESPNEYQKFRERMAFIDQELPQWGTVGLDSVTYAELAARWQAQFVLNPGSKEPRQWFAHSTDTLEQLLLGRLAGLRTNVVVLAHVDEDKDELSGTYVRNLKAPGRLRKGTGSGYMEVYKAFTAKDGEETVYALQTRTEGGFAACSQIEAPNPCLAVYEELWANWGGPRLPLHCLVYGDWGSGKSTFLASWPKPLLVWCFDPFGKHFPYLKIGGAIEEGEEDWGLKWTHVYKE